MWVVALTLLALTVRLYRLDGPVLRWDEGWSLAHASLPWPKLWQVAAEEWHPPAYVALLKLWLVAGRSAWSIRFLSVLLGLAAVPLAYAVGREWSGRPRVGLLAAGFAATWPLLVYYGQVTRMYPLAALAVLAAVWFMLRGEREPSWPHAVGLIVAAALALYTLYYTAWALVALWLYVAVQRPRRIPRLLALGLAALALYLPWLLLARTTLQGRLATGPAQNADPFWGTIAFLKPTLEGLAFTDGTGRRAVWAVALVLAAGLFAGPLTRQELRKLLLPLLAVGFTVLGVAYSAQASRWFAVRHLVPAGLFLGLAMAWALDRLAARWRPLLPVALAALALVYWPTCTRFVYEKTLEVVDPFDPTEDHRYLAQHAGPDDLVYFNVLARAGWYENLRRPEDPAWSYTMRWDPIIEPMERIVARIEEDARTHERLWFVLHEGDSGSNAQLVAWLAANLYPAGGEWQGRMLYLACVAPREGSQSELRNDRFAGGIRLKRVEWTPRARAGGACALTLTWEGEQPVSAGYKVFVHAVDEGGQLVAQHDGIPGSGLRPTDSWQPGVEVQDRHGLLLPATEPGRLQIRVGLYDPQTGERLPLVDGDDFATACTTAPW